MNHPIYRALVTYSNSTTGEIRVKIPSLLGIASEVPISYIGRSAPWSVPEVGNQIVVTSDDSNLTNIFWIQTDVGSGPTGPTGPTGETGPAGATGPAGSYNQTLNTTSNVTFNNVTVSGTLKAANQPTFVARKTASTFTPSTGTIVYDDAQLNIGSYYNTSTGRFTAPVAGVYCFTHILSARTSSSSGYEVAIGRNGLDATRVFHVASGQHHGISHHVMQLSAGDYIYASCYNPSSVVFSGSSDIYNDSGRNLVSGFMGYLLR